MSLLIACAWPSIAVLAVDTRGQYAVSGKAVYMSKLAHIPHARIAIALRGPMLYLTALQWKLALPDPVQGMDDLTDNLEPLLTNLHASVEAKAMADEVNLEGEGFGVQLAIVGYSERSREFVGRLCVLEQPAGQEKRFTVQSMDGAIFAPWDVSKLGEFPNIGKPGGIEAAAAAQTRYLDAHPCGLQSGGRLLKLVMTRDKTETVLGAELN